MIHHLYFRKTQAEARYQNAKDVLRLVVVGFVCSLALIGLLANFYVG